MIAPSQIHQTTTSNNCFRRPADKIITNAAESAVVLEDPEQL